MSNYQKISLPQCQEKLGQKLVLSLFIQEFLRIFQYEQYATMSEHTKQRNSRTNTRKSDNSNNIIILFTKFPFFFSLSLFRSQLLKKNEDQRKTWIEKYFGWKMKDLVGKVKLFQYIPGCCRKQEWWKKARIFMISIKILNIPKFRMVSWQNNFRAPIRLKSFGNIQR